MWAAGVSESILLIATRVQLYGKRHKRSHLMCKILHYTICIPPKNSPLTRGITLWIISALTEAVSSREAKLSNRSQHCSRRLWASYPVVWLTGAFSNFWRSQTSHLCCSERQRRAVLQNEIVSAPALQENTNTIYLKIYQIAAGKRHKRLHSQVEILLSPFPPNKFACSDAALLCGLFDALMNIVPKEAIENHP